LKAKAWQVIIGVEETMYVKREFGVDMMQFNWPLH
jgi:hypothetical protein